jgi:polyisoprenoid-binding protein YceI
MKIHHLARLPLLLAALGLSAQAAPLTFDFKDPKGVNNVQFSLDAPLESITGTGTGISGSVTFDPAQPAATKGKITLDTKSLTVGNPMMADHLRGANWLDVANHSAITFEAISLSNIRTQGNVVNAEVAGKLTVKGVTKDIKVPVSFTHLPDKLGARVNDPKVKGDLLVLRANFTINRADFGIQPGKNTDKVAETIQLSLSIAGAAPKA